MNQYNGTRTKEGCVVTVNGNPLNPRHDLYNHSPDGFEWGYEGSGPAQLALAILAHELQDEGRVCQIYQEFKRRTVALFHADTWMLDSSRIAVLVKVIEEEKAA